MTAPTEEREAVEFLQEVVAKARAVEVVVGETKEVATRVVEEAAEAVVAGAVRVVGVEVASAVAASEVVAEAEVASEEAA